MKATVKCVEKKFQAWIKVNPGTLIPYTDDMDKLAVFEVYCYEISSKPHVYDVQPATITIRRKR